MDAPAVAVTATGKTWIAAWMDCQLAEGDRDVFWKIDAEQRPLASSTEGEQGHVSLACAADGVFRAVWEDRRSGTVEVRGRSSRASAEERLLSDPRLDGASSFPVVACGAELAGVVYESEKRGVVFRRLAD